jgi:hypothetical protein
MKKARFSRAAYDNQQLQRKQLRCKIDIRYLSDQMANSPPAIRPSSNEASSAR